MPDTARNALSSCYRRFWLVALLLVLAVSSEATPAEISFTQSGPVPKLLELFTSQGCSSCPSADAFVNKLLTDDGLWRDIVPVVFHVDYWDYLGWADLYSDADYSSRQRRYRALGRVGSVYTPGFVLDAREWRGYFSKPRLPQRRKRYGGELNVESIATAPGRLRVSYTAPASAPPQHYAHLALLGFDIRTTIKSGENRGKKLPYEFTVLAFQTEALSSADAITWEQEIDWAKATRASPRYGLAVWITTAEEPTPAQVLGGWLAANQLP